MHLILPQYIYIYIYITHISMYLRIEYFVWCSLIILYILRVLHKYIFKSSWVTNLLWIDIIFAKAVVNVFSWPLQLLLLYIQRYTSFNEFSHGNNIYKSSIHHVSLQIILFSLTLLCCVWCYIFHSTHIKRCSSDML